MRCSLRAFMVLVAFVAALFGAGLLYQRSQYYRRQAALCAYFELQSRDYALTDEDEENWRGLSVEEKREMARRNRIRARDFRSLKRVYEQVAQHPWESLPPGTPASVNPWDLGGLSTGEIEEMITGFQTAQ